MERFSDSFGSSVFGATVARGTAASANFAFATSAPRDSQDAFDVADYGRNRERQAAGFEVLLCDPVADRRDSIIATIAEAGGTAHCVGMCDLEQIADWPSSWRLALLALGSSFNQAPLEVIDRLRKKGCGGHRLRRRRPTLASPGQMFAPICRSRSGARQRRLHVYRGDASAVAKRFSCASCVNRLPIAASTVSGKSLIAMCDPHSYLE